MDPCGPWEGLLSDGGSDDCGRGGDTSSSRSVAVLTTFQQRPGPGRRRSKKRTTRCGDRRLFHWGRGQASSRSLGRRRVTAADGTPRGYPPDPRPAGTGWGAGRGRGLLRAPTARALEAKWKEEEEKEAWRRREQTAKDEARLKLRSLIACLRCAAPPNRRAGSLRAPW